MMMNSYFHECFATNNKATFFKLPYVMGCLILSFAMGLNPPFLS